MELNFEGRTALVTNASQGIGRTTARMLALADVNEVAVARRVALVEQVAVEVSGRRIRELTHAVVPSMRERGWRRIVTFTGTSEPRLLNAAFTAKAPVHIWSKGPSREVACIGQNELIE